MAMVQFCGDDSDLDDAALWAVIDSAAASHSAQKNQTCKPSSSPQNQKTNSSRYGAVRELLNPPAPPPPAFPLQHLSMVTPDQKRGHKGNRRFPDHNALPLPPSPQQPKYHVDEESNAGEVVQQPSLHRSSHALTIYDNSNNEARRHYHNNTSNYSNNRNYNCNYAPVVKAKPLQQIAVTSPPPKRQHLVQELACRPSGSMDAKENNPAIVPTSSNVHNNFWNAGIPSAAMFKQYQSTAMSILEKGDYVVLQGKPFIKKSGWRKIAFFFNISFEIKDRTIQHDQNSNVLRAEFVVRASMQGGRFSDGWGSCDRGEKRYSKPNHDIPCTAETRAKTRACQDLLGIGEYKPGCANFG